MGVRTTRALVLAAAVAAVLRPGGAQARPVSLEVVAPSSEACPSGSAVATALKASLPALEIGAGPDALPIKIVDEGASFSVRAGGDGRRFDDPARVCEDRARKAAIYLALVLPSDPVRTPRPEIDEVPPHLIPASLPPLATTQLTWPNVQLEAGVVFTAAPDDSGAKTGGLAVRLFVGGRYVGGVVGLQVLAPAVLTFRAGRARIDRVPFVIGVRGRLVLRHLVLSLDATLVLGTQITEGIDVASATRQTRLEIGIAGTLRAEYLFRSRVGPLLQLDVEGIPRSYDLTLPTSGVLGHTPSLWLTAQAGLSVRLE